MTTTTTAPAGLQPAPDANGPRATGPRKRGKRTAGEGRMAAMLLSPPSWCWPW